MPYFETWSHENLVKFAQEAYEKLQRQEEELQRLRWPFPTKPNYPDDVGDAQALEALDWAADCIEPRKPHNCDCPVCVASDALRERLAQPERQGLATDSTIQRVPAQGTLLPLRTHWEGCEEVHPECRKPEQQRPPNCGTSYCSCIECVMKPEQPETVMAEYKFQTYAAYKTDDGMKIGVTPETRPATREEKIVNPGVYEVPVEQKPVAWRNAALRVGEDLCSVGPFGYYDMTAEQWLDWALSVVTVHTPPRREWVGLTLEEIFDCTAHITRIQKDDWVATDSDLAEFAHVIEAKLKEKNA